jgi:hypothetical protein
LTKSALSFIISSCLGVFSVLLTKSALPFIISSCLGVFCCWQSQHCPTEDTKAGWYDKGQCWLCQQQKTPRQDDMIKDSADFVNNRSALSFIISSCLGVFCCLQSQHCPLSYHLVLVSSVVYKVSIVLYDNSYLKKKYE